jgi:putative transposase
MDRISASRRTRSDVRSEGVHLVARLIIEEGLEGYRSGSRAGRLKTAEGVVEYAAPQISDRAVPFRARLCEIIHGRTEELEALAADYRRAMSKRCWPTRAANRC